MKYNAYMLLEDASSVCASCDYKDVFNVIYQSAFKATILTL